MATSKFLRTFRTVQGVPITTAAIWLVPQANTYPTGALALTPHATRDGQYYRDNVPDGEYKIYIDPAGGSSPTLYEEEIWIGEARITTISDHFDSADSYKLKTTGIKDGAITASHLASDAVETAKIKDLNITGDKIAEETIEASKLSFVSVGKNLFNKNTVTAGYYVNNANGNLVAFAGYNTSDYIPITAGETYYRSKEEALAFYNSSKVYISGIAGGQPNAFTAPANAAFCRHTVADAYLATLQIELGSSGTIYESHRRVLDKDEHNTDIYSNNPGNKIILGLDFVNILDSNALFVSKSGSDSNNGSVSSPFLTIDKAINSAVDGYTIYVNAGEYTENHSTQHGLYVSNKALRFVAVGEVIVKGNASGTAPIILAGDTKAVSFEGFTVDGETRSSVVYLVAGCSNKNFTNCTFKNGATYMVRQATGSNDANSFTNCTFQDFAGTYCLICYGGTTFDGCTFENISSGYFLYSLDHSNAVVFTNNICENRFAVGRVFYFSSSDSIITISGNSIILTTASPYWVILLGGTMTKAITVSDNYFYSKKLFSSNPFGFSTAGSLSLVIDNNEIHILNGLASGSIIDVVNKASAQVTNNLIVSKSERGLVSISVTSSGTNSENPLIKNNEIYNPATSGYVIRVGSDSSNAYNNLVNGATIHNNWIYGSRHFVKTAGVIDTHDIFVGYNLNASIKYNKIIGGGLGIGYKHNGSTNTTAIIAYNVIKNGKMGIVLKGQAGVKIYNNTIFADDSPNHSGIRLTNNSGGDGCINSDVQNNIIFTTSAVTTNVLFYIDADSMTGLTFNYNCLYLGAGEYATINGVTYSSHATLVSAGYNVNGINSDPKLVNVDNNDFWLMYNNGYPTTDKSPCIGVGVNLGSTYKDGLNYISEPREDATTLDQSTEGAAWEMGAYVLEV